jgi:hypothetical protein
MMTACFERGRVARVTMALAVVAVGCGGSSGREAEEVGLGADPMLTPREGAVLVDGCVLDTWQRSTLARPATKRVIHEVILLCLVPREDGMVGPRDPSARAALGVLTADLKNDGYRVHFGISFTDESGQRYDGAQTRGFLANPSWRGLLRDSLTDLIQPADGVELDLQRLPNDAGPYVTALVQELADRIRPARQLNVFVPPSVTSPSDLPGGDAFVRSQLVSHVDRMRIMTLDYSDAGPGPTIDPGWAVDAVRLARADSHAVDISYPLYGTDFGPRGHRSATYNEGRALAAIHGVPIERGATGAPFVRYDELGEPHELWFDDAESTGRALGAWSADVLPIDVGVLYYGLGAEDPALFERLSGRLP